MHEIMITDHRPQRGGQGIPTVAASLRATLAQCKLTHRRLGRRTVSKSSGGSLAPGDSGGTGSQRPANYYRDYRRRRKLNQQTKPNSNAGSPSVAQKDLSAGPIKSQGSGANSDAKNSQAPVMTGKYLLVPMAPSNGANSDAIFIELSVITCELADLQRTTGCYWQQDEVKVEV